MADEGLRTRIIKALSNSSPTEYGALKKAAHGLVDGGDPLPGFVRAKAVKLGIAFRRSGRLKPIAYRILR